MSLFIYDYGVEERVGYEGEGGGCEGTRDHRDRVRNLASL